MEDGLEDGEVVVVEEERGWDEDDGSDAAERTGEDDGKGGAGGGLVDRGDGIRGGTIALNATRCNAAQRSRDGVCDDGGAGDESVRLGSGI